MSGAHHELSEAIQGHQNALRAAGVTPDSIVISTAINVLGRRIEAALWDMGQNGLEVRRDPDE
jgi:hypothetical protein